jgi:hypothetical protein
MKTTVTLDFWMRFRGLIKHLRDAIVASSAFRTILFEIFIPTADAQLFITVIAVCQSISTFLVITIAADCNVTHVTSG